MAGSFDLLDPKLAPRGVATLLKTPFKSENRLDEASYRRQVAACDRRRLGPVDTRHGRGVRPIVYRLKTASAVSRSPSRNPTAECRFAPRSAASASTMWRMPR